uniref:Phlebovirus_G2 domain-containing protein n=1 Tax=Caenorhabditis tropicalis TaxID=1561998 RepID=A0A1I7U1R1_9PELO
MGQARIVIFDEDKRNVSQDVQLDKPESKSDKDQRLGHVEETSSTKLVASLSRSPTLKSQVTRVSVPSVTQRRYTDKPSTNKCCFCNRKHISDTCATVIESAERREILEKKELCSLCLYPATNKHKCRPQQCYYYAKLDETDSKSVNDRTPYREEKTRTEHADLDDKAVFIIILGRYEPDRVA